MNNLLQDISNFFGLGVIKEIKKGGGFANENYFVVTENGAYVIKIVLEKRFKAEDKLREQLYIERLREFNFPVVGYIKSPKGDIIYQKNDRLALIQKKIGGSHPETNEDIARQMGEKMAKLHKIPFDSLPEKGNWLQESYLANSIAILKKNFYNNKYIRELIKLYRALDFRAENLPKSIIHSDLFADNTLFENGKLVAIIDWEEVGIGPSLLDFGIAVIGFCFRDNSFKINLYKVLYESYNKNRPFTQIEERQIEEAVKYAAIGTTIWRFLYYNYYYPNEKLKNRFQLFWKQKLDKWQKPHWSY